MTTNRRLCIRTPAGGIAPYTGALGTMTFTGGISDGVYDIEWRPVRRLLSAFDGGMNGCPELRVYDDGEGSGEAPPPDRGDDPEKPAKVEGPDRKRVEGRRARGRDRPSAKQHHRGRVGGLPVVQRETGSADGDGDVH